MLKCEINCLRPFCLNSMAWHFSFCISIRGNLGRRECSVQRKECPIVGPTNDLIRGPPAWARQGWPFLPPMAQGDTWLVISPAFPIPWERPLETACSAIVTQENNAEMEGAREWAFRVMMRKIPSDGIVTWGQISLLYPPRSMGCAQQVEFIMRGLALPAGLVTWHSTTLPKKKSKLAWDFIWVVLRHSVGSGGEVGVRPIQVLWEEGKEQRRSVAGVSLPLV